MKVSFQISIIMLLGWFLPGISSAAIVSYESDSDFLANAYFDKEFGFNMRWGRDGITGDWEYAVVDGDDRPISPVGQVDWYAMPDYNDDPNHRYSIAYDQGAGSATMGLETISGQSFGSAAAGVSPAQINALVVRAKASSGDVSLLSDIHVYFAQGGDAELGSLLGDADAEYLMLVDDRLAGGFWIEDGDVSLRDGSGSVPMYSFKVGMTTVPLPSALLLFAPAILGFGALKRRR